MESYRNWKFDTPTDDAAFKFVLPEGAQKVKALAPAGSQTGSSDGPG